jgi:isochorismate hydrolase
MEFKLTDVDDLLARAQAGELIPQQELVATLAQLREHCRQQQVELARAAPSVEERREQGRKLAVGFWG